MWFYIKVFLVYIHLLRYEDIVKIKYTLIDRKQTEFNIVENEPILPEIGGIKLIYKMSIVRPATCLFGLIKFHKTEHVEKRVYYKPFKEIYGPEASVDKRHHDKNSKYYKIWLQLQHDFADISKEQYTLRCVLPKDSTDETKTVGRNPKLVSHLNHQDEIFYLTN
jgi:hypothetical protein